MPLGWRVSMLEARARAAVKGALAFTVTAADELPIAEAGALMAEVYSGGDDFPVVLVDGRIVCANGLDAQAVIAALAAL